MRLPFQGRLVFAAAVACGSLICLGGLSTPVLAEPRAEPGPPTSPPSREAPATPQRGSAPNSPADRPHQSPAVTAAQIRAALLAAPAKLVDLKLVVVERGNFNDRSQNQPVPVVYKEMWIHSRSAQVRMDFRHNGNGARWWTGFPSIKGPLTTAHLNSAPGLKECVDLSRDLVFADSRPLPPGPGGELRTLHSVSKSPQFVSNLFVPLVEFDKPWVPANRRGGAPVVDALARRPLSAWRVLGEEQLGTEEVILAEITQQETIAIPLKRHAGVLKLTQGYLAWFSKRHGLMPVRIEQTVRYGFQGRDYRLERRPDGQSPLLYEAADFTQFGGVWVPRVGSQSVYMPKVPDTPKGQVQTGFDFDTLADKLLADGTMRLSGELRLGSRYEWRILSIEPIAPSLKLWFEPQAGAEVYNMDTHTRSIEGDAAASKRFAVREQAIEARVGRAAPEFPAGATWLNGQPLTWKALRGKVVILDFWADWCGPCRNDLPRLRQLHDDRGKNGLIIIGVHVSGSELPSVKQAISELHLAYPICIDIPERRAPDKSEEGAFPSEFVSQFAIESIPHFVVVNRRGIVAASLPNRFQDALAIAEGLAKAKD